MFICTCVNYRSIIKVQLRDKHAGRIVLIPVTSCTNLLFIDILDEVYMRKFKLNFRPARKQINLIFNKLLLCFICRKSKLSLKLSNLLTYAVNLRKKRDKNTSSFIIRKFKVIFKTHIESSKI